jgi:hypothetical protein
VAAYKPNSPRPVDNVGLMKNLRRGADGRLYWHWDPARMRDGDAIKHEEIALLEAASRNIQAPVLLVRRSDPISQALLSAILDDARWSPSGGNLQPWRVIAVAGSERHAVVRIAEKWNGRSGLRGTANAEDRPIYPPTLWEPYRSRRFKVGEDLYGSIGIPRSNRERRLEQIARNFEFFGAPVGLFVLIDTRMAGFCF